MKASAASAALWSWAGVQRAPKEAPRLLVLLLLAGLEDQRGKHGTALQADASKEEPAPPQ